MTLEKHDYVPEKTKEQKNVDFALDAKSETIKSYTEIISGIEKKYAGNKFAENIIKSYLKNEITKVASVNGTATISETLKNTVVKYGKFFDYMKANLNNYDFAKKLGLNSSNSDPNTIVSTAIRNAGVTNESHKAILKFYATMRFQSYNVPNIYLTDIYEEEIKQVPLPNLLSKFGEIFPGSI